MVGEVLAEQRMKMDDIEEKPLQDNTDVSSRTRGAFFDKLSFSSADVEQKLLKPNSTCQMPQESSTELSWDLQTFAQRLEKKNLLYWG